MSYLNEDFIYREIIMDHVKNPRNIKKPTSKYKKIYLKNPACGDELTLYALFELDVLKDLTYEVSGCSICSSSVSMMSDLVKGKTKTEIIEIINNFNNMVTNKNYKEEILKDAISLKGVAKLLPRIKCATLSYEALSKIMGEK